MKLPACPHCGQQVRQTSRNNLSPGVAEEYASCTNPACPEAGATLVYMTSFQRTVRKKVEVSIDLALAVVQALPATERAKLSELLAQQAA